MHDIVLIVAWALITLTVAAFSIILGRRYTVAYPIAMMAMLMTVANIVANKLVVISPTVPFGLLEGPLVVAGGTIVYAATFLITDLISELWGKREARTAVWAGFYGALFLVPMVWIVTVWPSPPYGAEVADAFSTALGLTPRIVIASLSTYLIVQHLDVWLFHFWKRVTKGKHLWLRNNASTLVSQLVDALLFTTIAFAGVFPLLPLIIGNYLVKVLIALVDTPFMYGVRALALKVRPAAIRAEPND